MLAARCARLLAARRALSTEVVAPKFDFSELASFVSSDEAKREVAALKKTVEDIGNTLEAQAKARALREGCARARPRSADAPPPPPAHAAHRLRPLPQDADRRAGPGGHLRKGVQRRAAQIPFLIYLQFSHPPAFQG